MRKLRVHADLLVAESALKRALRDWKENSVDHAEDLEVRLLAWEEEFGVRLFFTGDGNEMLAYYLYCGSLRAISIRLKSQSFITIVPWMWPASEEERLRILGGVVVAEDYVGPDTAVRVIFSPLLCGVSRVYIFDYIELEARRLRYAYKASHADRTDE